MQGVRTWLLAVVLTLSAFSICTTAQDDDRVILRDDSFSTSGPVWISVTCTEVSCPGMELVVTADANETSHSDSHHVQWAGWVDETVSWALLAEDGTDVAHLDLEVVMSWQEDWTEYDDLPNIVPPPGAQGEYPQIDTVSPCQLHHCAAIDLLSEGVLYVGALENLSDKDALRIVGDAGDVMLLNGLRGPEEMNMEIWQRNTDSKILLESISSDELESHYFDYPPEGDLWLRLVHATEADYSPYEFEVIRYDDDTEAPGGGELSNPWTHGNPLPFYGHSSLLYYGHIAGEDLGGDSLLIDSGPKMHIEPNCIFTGGQGAVNLDIVLHERGGSTVVVTQNAYSCPDSIQTTEQTESIEFRITSVGAIAWGIYLRTDDSGDGSLVGDAPDIIWTPGELDQWWQVLTLGPPSFQGNLGPGDFVDVFAFNITEENGSYVRVDTIGDSAASYRLLTLNQETGDVENSTDGSMMIVPPGTHALVVEIGDTNQTVEYHFSLPYNGPYEPEGGEYLDLSYRAKDFYIFAGIFLLSPLLLVIWWNRGAIFSGAPLASDIEEHERRRLRRLRERLAEALAEETVDESEVEYALRQMGDSPWRAVVQDWGEPLLRHMTEQIEICVWRISEGDATLLLGIQVADEPWELAAMRIHAPEGAKVGIAAVSPSRLFQGGEIFLDKMPADSKMFLSLTLEGNPSSLGFQLSGLVGGQPLAAVPNRVLDWSD